MTGVQGYLHRKAQAVFEAEAFIDEFAVRTLNWFGIIQDHLAVYIIYGDILFFPELPFSLWAAYQTDVFSKAFCFAS